MSHQEKQEIFDQYAKKQGYQKWEDLVMFSGFTFSARLALITHMYNACDLVQAEQQNRIAENVKIEPPFEHFSQWIDKYSIINPENIIK